MRASRMEIGGADQPALVKTADDAEGCERLATEARRLNELRLAGLVEPIGFQPGPPAVLRLRWVGSHTLATARPTRVEGIAILVAELAETLAALHERGLGHSALIAEHVLTDGEGGPVLAGTGNLSELGPEQAADEVADLGRLLAELVGDTSEVEPIPDRRHRRHRRAGFTRRALATLADQAAADEPEIRPSAAGLADSLRATVGAEHRRGRPVAGVARTTDRTGEPSRSDPVEPAVEPVAEAPMAPVVTEDPILPAGDPGPTGPEPDDRELTVGSSHGPSAARPGSLGSLAGAARPRRLGRLRPGPGGPRRRVGVLVAVAAGAVVVWFGAMAASGGGSGPGPGAADPGAADRGAAGDPGTAEAPSTGDASAPVEPSRPAAGPTPGPGQGSEPCPDPGTGTRVVDTDGDGCPERVRVEAAVVTVGGTTYRVGEPDDRVAVGDWTCDGVATPALVRPTTGEVFVFDGWAEPGGKVTVTALTRVPDAQRPSARDTDDDGCPELVVTRRNSPDAVLAVGAGS